MKCIKLLLLFITCLLFSCQPNTDHFGIAKDYLPTADLLHKGVVNKYYNHIEGKKGMGIGTDIFYLAYQLNEKGELKNSYFNPDCSPSMIRSFSFEKDQMLLQKEDRYDRRGKAYKTEIVKPAMRNWVASISESEKTMSNEYGTTQWINQQQSYRDTILMNLPARIFEGKEIYHFNNETDTSDVIRRFKEVYVEGLGLYSRQVFEPKRTLKMELVEQIPMKQFQRQAQHNLHRVAYIDPATAMDKEKPFETCGDYIYDYYNGEQKLHYRGGKKAIWKIVNQHLERKRLLQESGYLSFRFIVNCNGEMGRFTTEQANLDFQPKQFSHITVDHCYDIARKVTNWIPTKIRGENVDAYFYLTFKLKKGKLIELLP